MCQNSHLLWMEMVKKFPQLKAYVQTQDFSFTGLGSMHTDSSGDIGHTLDSCPQDTLTETQM